MRITLNTTERVRTLIQLVKPTTNYNITINIGTHTPHGTYTMNKINANTHPNCDKRAINHTRTSYNIDTITIATAIAVDTTRARANTGNTRDVYTIDYTHTSAGHNDVNDYGD